MASPARRCLMASPHTGDAYLGTGPEWRSQLGAPAARARSRWPARRLGRAREPARHAARSGPLASRPRLLGTLPTARIHEHAGAYSRRGSASDHSSRVSLRPAVTQARRRHEAGRKS